MNRDGDGRSESVRGQGGRARTGRIDEQGEEGRGGRARMAEEGRRDVMETEDAPHVIRNQGPRC